ncbi:MAG TPA: BTAD domain-containing putative transcriptional regulator [Gemmatimonadaceae bacterium]|nr:BTAD domain-containing putative transcriptional regulator [Gemmatimonadaceae bacterium]
MIRLFLLGPQDARDDQDRSLRAVLAQPKRFGLLAYLAVEAVKGPRRRDEVLALFWPEADESKARRALTYALYFLRRELGQDAIVRHGADDLMIAPGELWTDVHEFERAADEGRFEDALALYRGDFLDGFYDADAPELEQWADARRLRLRERARTAAWGAIEAARRARDAAAATRWARRALELAPDDERALRELLSSLHGTGDVAGLGAEYEHFIKRFADLHGVAPSAETRGFYEALRATPVGVASPVTPVSPALAVLPASPASPVVSVPAPPPAPLTSRRWRVVLGSAAALVIAGVAYAFARTPARSDSAAVVAVLPFAYHGTPDLSYTREGIATLLAAGLDRAGGLRAVNSRVMLAGLAGASAVTVDDAVAAAHRFGAGQFVLGDITESGRRLRVTATVYDAKARPVMAPVVADGAADSLFDLVDRLTMQIAAARSRDTTAHALAAVAAGTHSIPALQAFLEGEHDFRTGQYDAAVLAYQRAIAADSTFALAFLRTSQAANWTGDYRLQRMADDRVQLLQSHLSPRDRLRAQAWHFSTISNRPQQSEALYRQLVTEDPTDVEAWYYLADLIYHFGPQIAWPADESRASWDHVLALQPNDASALIHVVRLAAASHDRAAFDSLATRLRPLDASEDTRFEVEALRAFAFGDSSERAALLPEARRLTKAPAALELAGHLTAASDDARGVAAFWRAIDNEPPHLPSHAILTLHRASVELALGHLRAASAAIDEAAPADPSMALRYRVLTGTLPFLPTNAWSSGVMDRAQHAVDKGDTITIHEYAAMWRALSSGLIAVRRGDAAIASRESATLDATAARGDWEATQLAPLLRGETTLLQGRTADALAALGPYPVTGGWMGDPSSMLLNAEERWVRAEVLSKLGRDREALRVLASIPGPNGGDIAYAPAAHLRQGELLEKLGQRNEAAAQYQRALDYWRTADAELAPLVARARAGVGRVGKQ